MKNTKTAPITKSAARNIRGGFLAGVQLLGPKATLIKAAPLPAPTPVPSPLPK